jgi:hypothetical protein
MYLPKADVFSMLKELKTLDYDVRQSNQNTFSNLPAVTFRVSTNEMRLDLSNDITSQDVEIIIDIWSEDSVTASNVLNDIERTMRLLEYRMTYSADVPDPKGLFHIVSRFKSKR